MHIGTLRTLKPTPLTKFLATLKILLKFYNFISKNLDISCSNSLEFVQSVCDQYSAWGFVEQAIWICWFLKTGKNVSLESTNLIFPIS